MLHSKPPEYFSTMTTNIQNLIDTLQNLFWDEVQCLHNVYLRIFHHYGKVAGRGHFFLTCVEMELVILQLFSIDKYLYRAAGYTMNWLW